MKRLLIDIPALLDSGSAIEDIRCEYLYHRRNRGQFSLLEVAEFAIYCRQCKDSFCVAACPKDALERQENGMIKRFNMRCVGCKSCVLACPFGTIFPGVINYITAKCDCCLNQLSENPNYEPACTRTAPTGAITMKEIAAEDPENQIYFFGDHVAIKSHHWRRKEGKV
jgi:Fe-S-cluster-containing dehydrogenase component